MEQGGSLFMCPIRPANDELGVEADENDYDECNIFEDSLGIEISGM